MEYLVTSRAASPLGAAAFLDMDRNYLGVESGWHQRLDCSGLEDRLRVRHQGAVQILGLWARVGVALFVSWASQPRRVRNRTLPHWQARHAGHRWQILRQVTAVPT